MSTIHPIHQHAADLAAQAGSAARTPRGIARAALAHYRAIRGRTRTDRRPDPAGRWEASLSGWQRIPLTDERRQIARLAAHPAERAAAQRRIRRMLRIEAADLAGWQTRAVQRGTKIRSMMARLARAEAWAAARPEGLRAAIQAVERLPVSHVGRLAWTGRAQPVVVGGLRGRLSRLPGHSDRERRDLSPRAGVSWEVWPGRSTRIVSDQEHRSDYRGHGRWRTAQTAQHILSVRSVAYLRDDGGIDWQVGRRSGTLPALPGWSWSQDAEGICLRRGGGDYHPDALDLLSGVSTSTLADYADLAAAERAEADRKSAAAAAEVAGVWVCWRDARRSGHCAAGVRQWCAAHGVDPDHHHPADTLLAKHGQDPRIQRIVAYAASRHQTECTRGWSDLADHGWDLPAAVACA
jgi:hypothetical protein